MTFLKNLSIRHKQTGVIMLTSSLALLLACAAFVAYDTVSFRRELINNVSVLAVAVGNNCAAAIDFNDTKSAEETLAALRANDNIIGACVYSQKGQVFAVFQRDPHHAFVPPPATQLVSEKFSRDQLHLVRIIKQGGVVVGTIFVACDLQDISDRLARYINIVGVMFLASMLLAYLLSNRLQRLISGPILNLVKVTRTVALEKNYGARAVKRSDDELGQLVDGFNEMLVQIEMRETALQTARDHLEQRVKERTAELAKANQAVIESQSLYYSLVEHLPAGVFRKDYEGRFVFVNSLFCRLKGHTAEKILGKTPRELAAYEATLESPDPSLGGLQNTLANQGTDHHETILRTGKTIEQEEAYPQPDGTMQYFQTMKSPVFGSDKKIVGSQGILFDITGRKQAEVELAYERDLLRSLLDSSPDQIYFKDAQSRFIKTSKAQALNFGLNDPDEMIGKRDSDFFAPEHGLDALKDEMEILRTGRSLVGKVEKEIWNDGRVSWVLTNKMPLRNKDGQIIGTFGISKDITELKHAQEEAAYERDLLRALLDNSPDQIYFKDLQSRFIKSSKAQAENFKVKDAGDLIGKTDFDFFSQEHARPAFEDEQTIMRTGVPVIGKVEKEVWPDGRECWVLASKMPLRNKDGKVIGTFGISKDITAMKKAEQKLNEVHRQLLETSRQAGMAEVATGVLHNVGNVLNSVNVSSTLVVDSLKKSKAPNLTKAAALIREHASDLGGFFSNDVRGKQLPGYLSQLADHLANEQAVALKELAGLQKNIEHIKDIVAMQQNYAKVSGVSETLNVSDLVEDALRMNASALERHEVKAIREFSDVPPVTVDKHKVLQILVNLIRNAKYACDESGRADRQIKVRITRNDSHVKISVIDNGVGIPRENLVRIFNHGFTTRKEGHGFGLHSGALAARELGGALVVHSDGLDQGATFTLELPCQSQIKTS